MKMKRIQPLEISHSGSNCFDNIFNENSLIKNNPKKILFAKKVKNMNLIRAQV